MVLELCNDSNRLRPVQQRRLMRNRRRSSPLITAAAVLLIAVITVVAGVYFMIGGYFGVSARPFTSVTTIAGTKAEFGEPFGIAVKNEEVFISDGLTGKIWRIAEGREPEEFADGLNTPSSIALDQNDDLIVADTGSHTIKKIDSSGAITVIAGAEGEIGDTDGPALSARFNAPVGVAVLQDGSIAVADTYNDKIKLIRNGMVTTIAGSARGFADGVGTNAKFDTPCGVAAWKDGTVLVADTANSRVRMVEANGSVYTIAGSGDADVRDGMLLESAFYKPTAIVVASDGSLFIADGNAIRAIKNRPLPMVETVTNQRRGFADGPLGASRFNRVSGIALNGNNELLIADSDNGAIRRIGVKTNSKKSLPEFIVRNRRTDPTEFRSRQPARWPYDPPEAKRDIAGTLGEIRGEVVDQNSQVWFHNGLDIAGAYGEKARFIRDEKVLNPISVENFDTLRELIRMPTIGYIHIRLGRDASDQTLGDARFQFDPGITGVRVRRGTEFKAGEVIGTLNAMNHVHMIAGPSGDEMNALDALGLPGVTDTIAPAIEATQLFDQNWQPIETETALKRIKLTGNTRIVVRAFDRMDGNPERRRLGVFRLGYQVLKRDHSAVTDVNWNITFDRNPSPDAVKFAYAPGSKSGATGETVFRYIVTNRVSGDSFSEGFLDTTRFEPGEYILRVFAADYFGNTATKDINFEVAR